MAWSNIAGPSSSYGSLVQTILLTEDGDFLVTELSAYITAEYLMGDYANVSGAATAWAGVSGPVTAWSNITGPVTVWGSV